MNYEKLWILLAKKKMTRAELSKTSGVSAATLSRMYRHNASVTLNNIMKIAAVLHVSPDEIIEERS